MEMEGPRRRFEIGARTGGEREAAVGECLVAQLVDAPTHLAAETGHGRPEDRDLVTGRDAVGDLDGADQLRGAGCPVQSVEGLVEAPPHCRLGLPEAVYAH